MIGRRCASGMEPGRELAGWATEGEGASYVYPSLEGVGAQRVGFEWDGATGFGFRKLGTGRRARWSVRGFAACSGRPACPPPLLLLDLTGRDGFPRGPCVLWAHAVGELVVFGRVYV